MNNFKIINIVFYTLTLTFIFNNNLNAQNNIDEFQEDKQLTLSNNGNIDVKVYLKKNNIYLYFGEILPKESITYKTQTDDIWYILDDKGLIKIIDIPNDFDDITFEFKSNKKIKKKLESELDFSDKIKINIKNNNDLDFELFWLNEDEIYKILRNIPSEEEIHIYIDNDESIRLINSDDTSHYYDYSSLYNNQNIIIPENRTSNSDNTKESKDDFNPSSFTENIRLIPRKRISPTAKTSNFNNNDNSDQVPPTQKLINLPTREVSSNTNIQTSDISRNNNPKVSPFSGQVTRRRDVPSNSTSTRINNSNRTISDSDCMVQGIDICSLNITPNGLTLNQARDYLKKHINQLAKHPATFERVKQTLNYNPNFSINSGEGTAMFLSSSETVSYFPQETTTSSNNCHLYPDVILLHELGHAYNYFINPQTFLLNTSKKRCDYYSTNEEKKVIEGWQKDYTMAIYGCHRPEHNYHSPDPSRCNDSEPL